MLALFLLAATACKKSGRELHTYRPHPILDSNSPFGLIAGRVVVIRKGAEVPAASANIVVLDTADAHTFLEGMGKVPRGRCTEYLVGAETLLLETARGAARTSRASYVGQADAEGYFRIDRVPPGSYEVVAYGQAGPESALWMQPLPVEKGKPMVVKLVSPIISCAPGSPSP
jgi:Polysaccharide lyase family 4, domain II